MIHRTIIGYLGTLGLFFMAFILYFIPRLPEAVALTTVTVTGYAIPNSAGLGYGILIFLIPIVVMGLLVGLTTQIGIQGDMQSFVMKLGLLIGCIFGMLSISSTAPTVIPFAFPIVAAVYFITYLWKGV
jgi:hypothetical protein